MDAAMTHDPMLDGITRWGHNGQYVLSSDLPALLAAAREDERGKHVDTFVWSDGKAVGFEQGQRDEREACIALVETVAQSGAYIDYVEIDSVIAAIRARSDGGES